MSIDIGLAFSYHSALFLQSLKRILALKTSKNRFERLHNNLSAQIESGNSRCRKLDTGWLQVQIVPKPGGYTLLLSL